MEYNMEEIILQTNKLEVEIGLKEGFYQRLRTEDNWSFLIKLHALIETSLSHLLSNYILISVKSTSSNPSGVPNEKSLNDYFSWLETGDKRTGKVALAVSLGIITKEQQKFICLISELRNKLVHRVENVEFRLEQHIGSLDRNQLRIFDAALTFGINEAELKKSYQNHSTIQSFIRKEPKEAIWVSGLTHLLLLCRSLKYIRDDEKMSEIDKMLRKTIVAKIKAKKNI
jgi:hypothetical protein